MKVKIEDLLREELLFMKFIPYYVLIFVDGNYFSCYVFILNEYRTMADDDSNRRLVTAMETVCVADKSKYPDLTISFPNSNVFDSFIASMIE